MSFSNRDNWLFEKINKYENISKEELAQIEIIKNLNKTLEMFKYKNLPQTLPVRDLELLLQCNGYAILTKVNNELYAFKGGLGGIPNPYYLPTIAIVANPALKFNKELKIGEECVVVRNDKLYEGLLPIIIKYSKLYVESEITLRRQLINNRIPAIVLSDNDNTKKTADDFFKKVEDGEEFGCCLTKNFFDGLKTFEFARQANIIETIEAMQYIKGSYYNEIGLNAQFNMKREAINEAEAVLNEDILIPQLDNMLDCRKRGIEETNKMFGYEIEVELNSVWETNKKEEKISLKRLLNEAREKGGNVDEDLGNIDRGTEE